MSEKSQNLKDVKCERCGRVIGQRRGNWLYRLGMWSHHPRSFTFKCPFLECEHVQGFKVNRGNKSSVKMALNAA